MEFRSYNHHFLSTGLSQKFCASPVNGESLVTRSMHVPKQKHLQTCEICLRFKAQKFLLQEAANFFLLRRAELWNWALVDSLLISYNLLELCNLFLSNLLFFYRRANLRKEIAAATAMTKYQDAQPENIGITKKLCLTEDAVKDESSYPYQLAVEELRRISGYYSPLDKLECVGMSRKESSKSFIMTNYIFWSCVKLIGNQLHVCYRT